MKEQILQLNNVCKQYGRGRAAVQAVCDASLKISKGDFIAIMGPSGAGKSTLMNLVGCLDIPTQGDIMLDNKNISFLTESELAQIRGRKIGFIFQQFNLIGTSTALENVALPMLFQDVPKNFANKKAKELLAKVGLKERINHRPNQLSGGEQQRVAIARALCNDPDIILADEPTGNLDSKTGEEVIKLLVELNKEGKTIIMVTHDTDVAKHAKKKVYVKDGKIVKNLK